MNRSIRPILALKETRLVGRESELATLQSALDSAAAAHGGMVVLAGEPGVGKTRLAHELLARAERRGFHCVIGRCFEQQANLPFGVWSEAFAGALAHASTALRSETSSRWPELVRLGPSARPDAARAHPRTDGRRDPCSRPAAFTSDGAHVCAARSRSACG